MGEVASATGTQSAGIEEISAAASRLDDMAQRSAALAEESAAAAQALKQQAGQLEKLVDMFRAVPPHAAQAGNRLKYNENTAPSLMG